MQVRSGTTLSWSGLPAPGRVLEDSQLMVEVQYRWRLVEWAGLEYQGTAFPALHPLEHNRVNQDLGIVFPLGPIGQFRLGTHHSWMHAPQGSQPWREGLRFQLGSTLRW
jgi:hypothetical protein